MRCGAIRSRHGRTRGCGGQISVCPSPATMLGLPSSGYGWPRGSERVEVACGGGRGRTGTVLAAMAMLDGLDADAAIVWVRRGYDARAVETPWQRQWLRKH